MSILLLLQTRGRLTARQLADELEVSVRTIYRDVDSLHAAGIPLYGDAGHFGGYQLLDGYRTRLTGLTAEEAESVFLTGLPGPAAELGLGTVVAAARLKLTAAMPPELRDRAGRIQQRFHLDTPGWYQEGATPDALSGAADAVWNQRRIEIRYRRWKAPRQVTRVLDPYGLVLKGGLWYLVAAHDGQARTYRVSQILDLVVLDEEFQRPTGFDLAAFWQAYLDDFEKRRHQAVATIRLAPEIIDHLADLVTSATQRAVTETAQPPDEHGWIRAEVPIEGADHAIGQFLRLGAHVEVLAPRELRDRMAETVAALGELYS